MPEVILPCPACGSTWVMANTSPSGADIVQCCNCYMHGPLCDSEEYAIERWNALPRMSALVAWQFQAAGLALALQREKAVVGWLASWGDAHPCLLDMACPFGTTYEACECAMNSAECWEEAGRKAVGAHS